MFKCIFLNENVWILTEISLKFVPKGSINNNPALFQVMAWRRPGDKPLSEPMMVSSQTHICVTRPRWVKWRKSCYPCKGTNAQLQWRHNELNGVSNHQPRDCLFCRSFRCRSKNTSKLRVTGLFEGNSPVTGEFHTRMASNAENVSVWWRHHGVFICHNKSRKSRRHEMGCWKVYIAVQFGRRCRDACQISEQLENSRRDLVPSRFFMTPPWVRTQSCCRCRLSMSLWFELV